MQYFADLVLEYLRIKQLLGVFPFVQRLALVEPFVALQPDEILAHGLCEDLAEVGFAHSGRTFHQYRLLELTREINHGGDTTAGDIVELGELLDYVLDR